MRWPRRPVAGLLFLAVGGSAAGVLTLMLGGAAMILVEPEEALAWATAITERLSNLRGPAAQGWAAQYINYHFAATLVLFSFIPYWFARRALPDAYASLLPLGVSSDGLMHVEFAQAPRVGGTVRGRILLGHEPRPGETFGVKLSCQRREPPAIQDPGRRDFEIVDVFVQTREASARLEGERWVLDFAFDVPDSAPATPHGVERLSLASMYRAGTGLVAWAVQATDADGDHEIEFDMGHARVAAVIGQPEGTT